MKKTRLLIACLACCFSLAINAQVIKGGAFESWNTLNYENPNNWFNSNDESAVRHGVVTISKVTGVTANAIRLETKAVDGDLYPGYFTNTQDDPTDGEGGVPYGQKPDSITGWYKCDVKSGDTAIFLVVFKKMGIPISFDMHKFTGTVNNFTRFAFKVNPLLVPDTVIIAAASSNAIEWIGVAEGSTITFDKLEFVGAGITQTIPQGGFDNWTSVTHHTPNYWSNQGGGGITRTTDNYKGDYAIRLTTVDESGDPQAARISNGQNNNFSQSGGEAYSGTNDTLMFWYKYAPQGNDSGECFVSFYKNGANVYGFFVPLPAASNWTAVSYPFSIGTAVDTIQITFGSSTWPYLNSNIGSLLTVDEVQLASSRLHTSIAELKKINATVYPNPGTEKIKVSLNGTAISKVEIYDLNGRLLSINKYESAISTADIDVSALNSGLYFIKAISADGNSFGQSKFVKE